MKQDARVEKAIGIAVGVIAKLLPDVAGALAAKVGREAVLAALSAFGVDTGSVTIAVPAEASVVIQSKKKTKNARPA